MKFFGKSVRNVATNDWPIDDLPSNQKRHDGGELRVGEGIAQELLIHSSFAMSLSKDINFLPKYGHAHQTC